MVGMKMFLMQGVLVILLVASSFGHKVIDCTLNAVTIQWRPALNSDQKLDLSKAHLGTCPPSSIFIEDDVLLFSVWLHDCGFKEVVSEDRVTYTNLLTYNLHASLPLITEPVECVYDRYSSSADVNNVKRDLVFTLELMNNDFNGPAPFTMFTFDTRINILAKVQQQDLLAPVQIYLQSCMLANTTDLTQASQLHTLISDAGCLKESKEGNAKFLPRRDPTEIRFYFQPFKFATGEQVFLHCDMATLDLQTFSVTQKACQYLQHQNRWELLDDPAQSDLCSCCDFTCIDGTNSESGIYTHRVLGPFAMVDSQSSASDESFWPAEQELGGVPIWVVALTVCLVLILMAGAIATSYYLCFWRGGRMGYRPSRELLNKY
ncbi:zona pellucida sperm-binding protein 3-like [Silurus meridionalis]|uniref:ZP domain-containing protein n=1 Tax=Silurus meridionalis TaxID=175797 RepID=A0A8T0A999_SILME|nr:zona pellucida sperm-binding protein 3-like [Silurus meridionalis]KAF7688572.1 hypothetical protein HF521_013379 [Silurus meridionalis]